MRDDLNRRAAEKIEELTEIIANNQSIDSETLGEAFRIVDELRSSEEDQDSFVSEISEVESFDITEGDFVEDENPKRFVEIAGIPNVFEVVEVTEERAEECVIKPAESQPENHDKTVADENPGYPSDDVVVDVSPIDRDAVYSYPISRLNKLASLQETTS